MGSNIWPKNTVKRFILSERLTVSFQSHVPTESSCYHVNEKCGKAAAETIVTELYYLWLSSPLNNGESDLRWYTKVILTENKLAVKEDRKCGNTKATVNRLPITTVTYDSYRMPAKRTSLN